MANSAQVMRDLSSSEDYKDSLEELDAALCEINSNPYFPQVVDLLLHVRDILYSISLFFMLSVFLTSTGFYCLLLQIK